METIHIYINTSTSIRLEFYRAVQPASVPSKADSWYLIYRMYSSGNLFDKGLYTATCFFSESRQILIAEEYKASILDTDIIEVDNDVTKNLRLFDFATCKTGRFSRLNGGSFLLQRLAGNDFIFSKQQGGVTTEFSIDITQVKLTNFDKL